MAGTPKKASAKKETKAKKAPTVYQVRCLLLLPLLPNPFPRDVTFHTTTIRFHLHSAARSCT